MQSSSGIRSVRRLLLRNMNTKYAQLPKIELHVHADGACRVSTLQELSRKHKCPYPHDDIEKFRPIVTLPERTGSLEEFLKVFGSISSILKTKEDLERIAYEFCEDSARENVVYAEYRYYPLYLPSGEDYCEGILAGLERGQRDFNIKVRSILAFKREEPETVMEVVRLARRYQDRGVVGVDIAGNELLPLDPQHVAGFKLARESGLHVTVHAAESGPAENVREAAETLGAERIGHGYHVLDNPEVYSFAKDKKLHFETCPTSSVFTNSATFEKHAMKEFARDGVSFSINTDDPGVMQCTLTGEYDVSESELSLTQHQLMKTVWHAAEATFLPPDEKEELKKVIKEKLLKFDPTFTV